MINAIDQSGIDNILGIRIRSDNGTQSICNTVENFLSMMNTYHERIHPATPKEERYTVFSDNCHNRVINKVLI